MIALLLIGFVLIALLEVPALVRKRWWRELIIYSLLLTLGLALSLAISLGAQLPYVATAISNFIIKALRL
jgi:hypothetical protein